MKPSEYLKHMGFDSLKQLSELTKVPVITLQVWYKTKPVLFKTLAAGAIVTLRSCLQIPSTIRGVEVFKTDEYHEDFGNVIFMHFENFDEPCILYFGSAIDSTFDESFWTHFIRGVDFNYIYEQAEQL